MASSGDESVNGAVIGPDGHPVLRWSGDSVVVGGVERRVPHIERFLVAGTAPRREDAQVFGFRTSYAFMNRSRFIRLHDVLRAPHCGGVIVGEGDSGKSWYVNMMERDGGLTCPVRVFRLRNYIGAIRELVHEIEKCSPLADEASDGLTVVFDGLDENRSAWSVLAEIVGRFARPNRLRVWVTSRVCDALDRLREMTSLPAYHLAPFSEDEVEELVSGVGVDGRAFYSAITSGGVLPLASTPGGLVSLLNEYGRGSFAFREDHSCKNLMLKIVTGYVRESRDGRKVPVFETQFGDDELFDCVGWIATAMWLSRKRCIDHAEVGATPDDAIRFSLLCRGRYGRKMIQALMNRRIFEPLTENLTRFVSDEVIVPFLVAKWLVDNAEKMIPVLLPSEPEIVDEVGRVLRWVAAFRPKMAHGWLMKAPCFFLDCHDAVRSYGLERFYALFEQECLKVQDYPYEPGMFLECESITSFYDRLVGQDDLAAVAVSRFEAKSVDAQKARLAACIVRYVGRPGDFGALTRGLARHWHAFDVQDRFEIMSEMLFMHGDCPELEELKPHLDDPEDGFEQRAELLALLWPQHLTVSELLTYLRQLDQTVGVLLFDIELGFAHLCDVLRTKLDRKSIVPCLEWAAEWRGFGSERVCDFIAERLVLSVFIGAWRWATDPEIARLLAQIVEARAVGGREEFFSMPIEDVGSSMDVKFIRRDVTGRMAVFEAYARQARHDLRRCAVPQCGDDPFGPCYLGLVYCEDGEALEALRRKLDDEEPGGIAAQRVEFALQVNKSPEFTMARCQSAPTWFVPPSGTAHAEPDLARSDLADFPPVDDSVLNRLAAEPTVHRETENAVGSPKKTVRKVRVNRMVNVNILREKLRELIVDLFKIEAEQDRLKMHDEFRMGKTLSVITKIREGTIGDLIELKNHKNTGKRRCPDKMSQIFYNVLADADAFTAFREHVRDQKGLRALPVMTVNELERTLRCFEESLKAKAKLQIKQSL